MKCRHCDDGLGNDDILITCCTGNCRFAALEVVVWQLSVLPIMTLSSKWNSLPFSDGCVHIKEWRHVNKCRQLIKYEILTVKSLFCLSTLQHLVSYFTEHAELSTIQMNTLCLWFVCSYIYIQQDKSTSSSTQSTWKASSTPRTFFNWIKVLYQFVSKQ